MSVEWQGDHKLLADEKVAFERELKRLGLDPSNFLVQVGERATTIFLPFTGKRYTICGK